MAAKRSKQAKRSKPAKRSRQAKPTKRPRQAKPAGRSGAASSRPRRTASARHNDPLDARIRALQRRIGVEPDGVIGPLTLTRLEELLGPAPVAPVEPVRPPAEGTSLTVSTKGVDMLVAFEVSSETAYAKKYQHPIWPGGESGVTIGIGYDLAHQSPATIRRDWAGLLADADIERLVEVSGLAGARAKAALARVADVVMPFAAARKVFYLRSLPKYATTTRGAYPGVEALPADAQAGLLSLVYNRGAGKKGDRRREMAAIELLVAQDDLAGIAAQIRAMKRLWDPRVLPGLIDRREKEAQLVEHARRAYAPEEFARV